MSETLRYLLRHKSGLTGLVIVLTYVLIALLADVISPYDPLVGNLGKSLRPPSPEHLLGTDELGRDILSRVIHGARISLLIAAVSASLGCLVGSLLGLVAGYSGGLVDYVIMRVADMLLSLPSVLLAIALVALLGPGVTNVIIALAVGFIPTYVRLVRGVVLQVKGLEYVTAAQLLGLSTSRILFKHILPNVMHVIIAYYTLNLGTAILFASGLGFLGLGVQPPTPEWGVMIGTGRSYIFVSPHVIIVPGIFLTTLVLGFNLLGNALRDVLDPVLRGGRV